VLLCGRWFLLALCGACGGNDMIETSKTKKGHLRSSELSFFILCTLGLLDSLTPLVISFHDFLILFSSPF
jgi:hypothetical protein